MSSRIKSPGNHHFLPRHKFPPHPSTARICDLGSLGLFPLPHSPLQVKLFQTFTDPDFSEAPAIKWLELTLLAGYERGSRRLWRRESNKNTQALTLCIFPAAYFSCSNMWCWVFAACSAAPTLLREASIVQPKEVRRFFLVWVFQKVYGVLIASLFTLSQ